MEVAGRRPHAELAETPEDQKGIPMVLGGKVPVHSLIVQVQGGLLLWFRDCPLMGGSNHPYKDGGDELLEAGPGRRFVRVRLGSKVDVVEDPDGLEEVTPMEHCLTIRGRDPTTRTEEELHGGKGDLFLGKVRGKDGFCEEFDGRFGPFPFCSIWFGLV